MRSTGRLRLLRGRRGALRERTRADLPRARCSPRSQRSTNLAKRICSVEKRNRVAGVAGCACDRAAGPSPSTRLRVSHGGPRQTAGEEHVVLRLEALQLRFEQFSSRSRSERSCATPTFCHSPRANGPAACATGQKIVAIDCAARSSRLRRQDAEVEDRRQSATVSAAMLTATHVNGRRLGRRAPACTSSRRRAGRRRRR